MHGTVEIWMPELRQDMVTGKWVVVATDRAMRPHDFSACRVAVLSEPRDCPFCPGNEIQTPLELYAVRPESPEPNTPGWLVRVVPNKFPAFVTGAAAPRGSQEFPRRPASGSHEVIIHSPDHYEGLALLSPEQVELVLRVYRQRYGANSANEDVRYIHLAVNYGKESGASLEHPHSQLFGAPLVPTLVHEELAGASWHMGKRDECVLCRMVEEELAAGDRMIVENEAFVAFAPFASRFPFEVWIVPRGHRESFGDIDDSELTGFAWILRDVLQRIHSRFENPAYNYYIHTAPCDGSEYPYYHWHLEMVPKLTTPGAFELGTSMWINVTTPEHAAAFLAD